MIYATEDVMVRDLRPGDFVGTVHSESGRRAVWYVVLKPGAATAQGFAIEVQADGVDTVMHFSNGNLRVTRVIEKPSQ